MTLTLKRTATAVLSATASPHYEASSVNTQIDAMTLTNNSASIVTVSLWTPVGGAPTINDVILKDEPVAAGRSVRVWSVLGHVIPDGAMLYAQASVAGVVTLVMSGREQAVAT